MRAHFDYPSVGFETVTEVLLTLLSVFSFVFFCFFTMFWCSHLLVAAGLVPKVLWAHAKDQEAQFNDTCCSCFFKLKAENTLEWSGVLSQRTFLSELCIGTHL